MAKRYEGRKLLKPSTLRGVVAGAVALAVVVSIVFHTGWGTLSALGIGEFYLLCPLGGLEAMLGSRSVAVHALAAIVVVVIAVLVVGKSFCAWACPVGFLSRFLMGKRGREAAKQEQASCAKLALCAFEGSVCAGSATVGADVAADADAVARTDAAFGVDAGTDAAAGVCSSSGAFLSDARSSGACETSAQRAARASWRTKIDSRHFVLVGALGSALVFGFPVFCLICPIGLTFATVVSIVRLIGFNEPSMGLIVFPALIVVELVVLRKWCHTLCPVGALLSLLSSFNRVLRPRVDEAKCLRYTKGEPCSACSGACPELIDPHSNFGMRSINECTRCGKCAEACPQGAIGFTLRGSTASSRRDKSLGECAPEVHVGASRE